MRRKAGIVTETAARARRRQRWHDSNRGGGGAHLTRGGLT